MASTFGERRAGRLGAAGESRAWKELRYDFACEKLRILVELQGGNYQHGAHSRPMGLKRDYQKANLAQRHGWTIYQFDSDSVRDGEAILWIMEEYER